MSLKTGWEPLPSEVWHEIAGQLSKPWTTGQAAHDLRVHASDVRLRRARKMPGRVLLTARWGWPDRRVRSLLKAEASWQDPRFSTSERTTGVPPAYHSRTTSSEETQVEPSPMYQSRTTAVPPVSTRADLHSTQITDHKNNNTPPTPHGGSPSPAPKSKPRKRTAKKASGLTVEAIHAIPIPEALIALEGFTEKWQAWTRLRQDSSQPRKRWREAQQIAAILSKLGKWHTGGLDVLAGLESAYTSSWQGISKSYLEPVALRRSSKPVVSMLNNPPDMSRLIPRKARPAPDLLTNRYTRKVT